MYYLLPEGEFPLMGMLNKFFERFRKRKSSEKKDRYRAVIVYLDKRLSNRLHCIQEHSGEDDPTKVVRNALQVYEYLVLEHNLGTEFYVKDKETGEYTPHVFVGPKDEESIQDEDEDED
jgi:hypothetical protein